MTKPHCISAYILHKQQPNSKYLLLRRCGDYLSGTWQMVSGGIEEGETASQAALREVQEETGIEPDAFYSADIVETFYWGIQDRIVFAPVFVALVDTPPPIKLSPKEHDLYEWLSFEQAIERLAWSEQKRALAHIHEQFALKNPPQLLQICTNFKLS